MVAESKISLEKADVFLIEDGILENHVKAMSHIEESDIWAIKKSNLSLTSGKPYCILVTAGHLSSISKEAKEVTASKDFAQNTIAKAILVDSLGHKIVGNLYVKLNKPYIKTKVFTSRDLAIAWLQAQIRNKPD
ncbi:MAG: hypothetical protein J0L69_09315 [Bacteroidetes bacterium]|nr:hypothetical protein [Bacteroidota bacterium]